MGSRLPSCASASNPVLAAFMAYKAFDAHCPPRFSWDPATVFYAVRGLGPWWDAQGGGRNTVNRSDVANLWVDAHGSNQAYLILKPGMMDILAAEMDDLLCMQPCLSTGVGVRICTG